MPAERPQVDVSFVDPDSIEMIESHMGSRGRTVLSGLLLVGLVLAVYARALSGGFVVLDNDTVLQNMPLRSLWPGLWNIWVHPIVSPHYQPLAYSLLALEFRIFGARIAAGYLAINVLLHLANVLLFWEMLRRLEIPGAIVAAAIFAIHPINVQAVGWISQQPLLLCGSFALMAMFVWMRWTGIDPGPPDTGKIFRLPSSSPLLLALLVILLGCAMASHAIAIALPGVMLAMVWWERAQVSQRERRVLSLLGAISLLWLLITLLADARRADAAGSLAGEALWTHSIARLGDSWGYLWHSVLPVGLSLVYPAAPLWIAGIVATLLAALLVLAWRMRPRSGRGPFAAIVVIAILLLPTLLVRTDLDQWTNRADQLFYLPLMVLAVVIVEWLRSLLAARPSWLGSSIAMAAGALLAVLSVLHIGDFHDSQRLWESVLRTHPDSVIALNQLGLIEMDEHHDYTRARARFQRALEKDPDNLRSLLNLAHSYELEGDWDRMSMRYHEALAMAPDDPEVHMGLGSVLAAKGHPQEAIEEFNGVLEKQPGHYQTTYRLALAYRALGDVGRAEEVFNEAIRLNPGEAAPYIDLANIAFARGHFDDAVRLLETAAGIDPGNFRVYVNVGAQLGTLAEDHPELSPEKRNEARAAALKYLRVAVQLNPDSPEARYNLGGVLFNARKLDEAIYQLSKAVELSPTNNDFRRALQLAQRARQEKSGR